MTYDQAYWATVITTMVFLAIGLIGGFAIGYPAGWSAYKRRYGAE